MTAQEVLDHVAKHLLVDQGVKCLSVHGGCAYHEVIRINGVDVPFACAVGCLILPERYTRELEGMALTDLCCLKTEFESVLAGVINVSDAATVGLLEALQSIHDNRRPSAWFEHFRAEADVARLQLNVRRDELNPWCRV